MKTKNGFTMAELLVAVLITGILAAVALPYYFNAVENARITEVVLLWGRQKNFISGKNLSEDQARRATESIQNARLKKFTGRMICRPGTDPDVPCWEALFTQLDADAHAQYNLTTARNLMRLACVPLNSAGREFCQSQAGGEPPSEIDGQEAYFIR